MRIELANDQWIEVRDRIKGGDIFAVLDAGKVTLDEDGRAAEISYQGIDARQFRALAQRTITAWSFQVPLPSSVAAATSVIDDLDEDDYWELYRGLKPKLDKIKAGGPGGGGGGGESPKTDETPPTS
jgi:hypothetical protein